MKNQANLYIVRVLLQRILGVVLFLVGSNGLIHVRSMVYFSMYIVFAVVSMALIRSTNADTLAARAKIASNTPLWDKILLAFYWVAAYFVIYFVAGLEMANEPVRARLGVRHRRRVACSRVSALPLGGSYKSVS